MTDEEILVEAARRIQLPGMWWQETGEADHGMKNEEAGCLFTTVHRLALQDGRRGSWPIEQALLKELGVDNLRRGLNPLFQWNDTPGRTVEEVVTVLLNSKRWL